MTVAIPEVSLDPALRAAGDMTHFWRVPRYRLECLRATFRRYAYVRHTHETYAIAAILDGCETFIIAASSIMRAPAQSPWSARTSFTTARRMAAGSSIAPSIRRSS